jgi:hypothetical protein
VLRPFADGETDKSDISSRLLQYEGTFDAYQCESRFPVLPAQEHQGRERQKGGVHERILGESTSVQKEKNVKLTTK